MPPPLQSDDLFDSPVEDPVRHKIEETLKAELDAACAAYYCARQEFRLFVANAIRRFNALLADGKLPAE